MWSRSCCDWLGVQFPAGGVVVVLKAPSICGMPARTHVLTFANSTSVRLLPSFGIDAAAANFVYSLAPWSAGYAFAKTSLNCWPGMPAA